MGNLQPVPPSLQLAHHSVMPRPRSGELGPYELLLDEPAKKREPTIALIAHDGMKPRMMDFAVQYENELGQFDPILATGTTGKEVGEAAP